MADKLLCGAFTVANGSWSVWCLYGAFTIPFGPATVIAGGVAIIFAMVAAMPFTANYGRLGHGRKTSA